MSRKEEIENYIEGWHWDKPSEEFAFKLGKYLFDFIEHLEDSDLSERTVKRHKSNCWSIGTLMCQYGYQDKFSPQVLAYPPYHEFDFIRKHSSSESAVASYNSTCNKLEKYALEKEDLKYDE